jgi:excisionase family DNA binding protein
LTTLEAAAYCRVNASTLWRARQTGALKASGPGSAVRYHIAELDRWMDDRTSK